MKYVGRRVLVGVVVSLTLSLVWALGSALDALAEHPPGTEGASCVMGVPGPASGGPLADGVYVLRCYVNSESAAVDADLANIAAGPDSGNLIQPSGSTPLVYVWRESTGAMSGLAVYGGTYSVLLESHS